MAAFSRATSKFAGILLYLFCSNALASINSLPLDDSIQQHNNELIRQLAAQYNDDNSTFIYDLSDFSLRFDKCQSVQMFNDELARQASGTNGSPLASYSFVVFRLCPIETCNMANTKSGETCGSVYGSYTLDVGSYLEATIDYQKQEFEYMCANCEEACEDESSCSTTCGKLCWQHNNLEANGYVDAANYIQCQEVDINNGNDDGAAAVFVGPVCSQNGAQIQLGVFSDANCLVPIPNVNVSTVLSATPSYRILATTYSSSDNQCLSCSEKEVDENGNNENPQNDQWDDDTVNEMCERLYNQAAKCESETGLVEGFIQTARKQEEENGNNKNKYYSNQVENEFMACTFIKSLIWNSYTQTGEINFSAKQDVIVRVVTKKQKMCLSLVSVAFISLIGLLFYFQQKIKNTIVQGSGKGEESLFI